MPLLCRSAAALFDPASPQRRRGLSHLRYHSDQTPPSSSSRQFLLVRRSSSPIPLGEELGTRLGSKLHNASKAETTGCAQAFRRACDSQPRDRSGSAVGYPARRKRAQGIRFRRWSGQCSCRSNLDAPAPSILKFASASCRNGRLLRWNASPGDKINRKASQPMTALVMLACHSSQASPPVRLGSRHDRRQPLVVLR